MAQYSRYWSCSKLADWIRGTEKGSSKSGRGWSEWTKASKENHPYRHWLAEDGLDYLQNFVYWPSNRINDIIYYFNNRWVTKSHALTAHPRDVKPGAWCDVGRRFLPCMFNELVDFVEIEQAWSQVVWDEDARKKFKTPWWRKSFLRLRTWRSPEAGMEYLNWASTLIVDETWGIDKSHPDYGKLSLQAENALEIKALYQWWTEVYLNRPDPYDISGWSEICNRTRADGDILSMFDRENTTPDEVAERNVSHTELKRIEEEYEKEEEEMMIRLIRIRNSLWT